MIDDSHVMRGLVYLFLWFVLGMPALAFIGALLFGAGGAAVGAILNIPLGLWGYSAFLDWHLKRILSDYDKRLASAA